MGGRHPHAGECIFDYQDPNTGKDIIIWGLMAHLLIEAARHVFQMEPSFEFEGVEGGDTGASTPQALPSLPGGRKL